MELSSLKILCMQLLDIRETPGAKSLSNHFLSSVIEGHICLLYVAFYQKTRRTGHAWNTKLRINNNPHSFELPEITTESPSNYILPF